MSGYYGITRSSQLNAIKGRPPWHVLKPETPKRNDRNKRNETTETTKMKPTKRQSKIMDPYF